MIFIINKKILGENKMLIGGFMKQSFIDFPQTLSSIIFTNGCNLNCWYCHNRQLINGNSQENYSIDKIYEFLESRKNFIEGVVISGGEPTIQPDLESVIDKIKSLNLKVKLDTNGTNPKVLKHLMTTNKIDYVAMDIKNSLKNYDKIICLNIDQDKIKNLIDNIKESVETLLNQDVIDYEFRTTFSPDISLEDIEEIGKLISGAKRFYLQKYNPVSNQILTIPHTLTDFENAIKIMKNYVPNSNIRGF